MHVNNASHHQLGQSKVRQSRRGGAQGHLLKRLVYPQSMCEQSSLPPPAPAKEASSSPGNGTVCCMCGDHGLLQELFQCKLCLVRFQHKYCSELYLKTATYKACNWCLREDEGAAAAASKLPVPKDVSKSITSGSRSGGGGAGLKIRREVFAPQLDKPIKKLRLLDGSASDVAGLPPSFGKGKQQVGKGKARRYKLLEEVVSS